MTRTAPSTAAPRISGGNVFSEERVSGSVYHVYTSVSSLFRRMTCYSDNCRKKTLPEVFVSFQDEINTATVV